MKSDRSSEVRNASRFLLMASLLKRYRCPECSVAQRKQHRSHRLSGEKVMLPEDFHNLKQRLAK